MGENMTAPPAYQLTDRYRRDDGQVFVSGVQALARLPIEQLRADRRAGLDTAAFISGYPGSPLGGYDQELSRACRSASELPIICRPGMNEEYAATAVMGSQLANAHADARYDGVVGIWYGKAPGVDRASDALRHAVYAGTSNRGGAIALVGDDPIAKSSTVPSSSAGLVAQLHMPLFYPGDPCEALDLGRHAVALSRASGLWSALKIVSDVADGTATITLDPDRVTPLMPEIDGQRYATPPRGALLAPLTLELEREIYEVRYDLAVRYAALNQLNRSVVDPSDAWIGIVASGITYREVREALSRLGLATDDDVAASGIRLLKMQLPIPFDPETVRRFARGLDEIFVIEEKQPNLELLIKDALFRTADAPSVVGKKDESEAALLPGFGALDADTLAPALRARLSRRVEERLRPLPPPKPPTAGVSAARTPYFCSGCPHNRSTRVPDDALIGVGIGCSTMVMMMDESRVGEIAGITAMGNEGTQWIGMSEFIEREHFTQNLGDGTYFHSGQLAIQAAVAAGARMTFKLLYNGAVAMTGGQHPEGQVDVPALCRTLLDHGVARVLVTADDPGRYAGVTLPKEVVVWSRDRLVEAQETLARVDGVTVLIHDQACAAETRRLRRRGLAPTPDERVVINHRICEGCGDCGDVSNCLSVQPITTPFGRKTTIDQTTCNFDFSCLEGDCPAFMTIRVDDGGSTKETLASNSDGGAGSGWPTPPAELPAPEPVVPTDEFSMRITGIGGTGVVTVAQIIATAAMFDGFDVRGLDQVGLSQKAGPVVSDLRLSKSGSVFTNRLGSGQADLLLALDLLVAASDKGLRVASRDRTTAVGSTSSTPTGHMVADPRLAMPDVDRLRGELAAVSREGLQCWADAATVTRALFGDATTANLFVVGMASQAGALPIDPRHVEDAIRLNGVAVDANIAAFRWGRCRVHAPERVDEAVVRRAAPTSSASTIDAEPISPRLGERVDRVAAGSASLRSLLRRFVRELVAYQSAGLADRYLDRVERVAESERKIDPGATQLTRTVARSLYKLLAYKDEYEVARLMIDPENLGEAQALAGSRGTVAWRLHPPLLKSLGLRRKIALPTWTRGFFRLLARGRFLRGTPLDPFGRTALRRIERALPAEFEAAIDRVLAGLSEARLEAAIRIAELPDQVRGYEDLTLRRVAEYRARLQEELECYEQDASALGEAGSKSRTDSQSRATHPARN